MGLAQIKRLIRELDPGRRTKLALWLREVIGEDKAAARRRARQTRRPPAGGRKIGRKSFRRELIRCGKAGCRCEKGELHGPYWYAYWDEGGRTRSQYVGRELPPAAKAK